MTPDCDWHEIIIWRLEKQGVEGGFKATCLLQSYVTYLLN